MMLPQDTTVAMAWGFNTDKTDYVLIEQVGSANIGFTWNGTVCITNQPKPEVVV
jgi:hypothetical protein